MQGSNLSARGWQLKIRRSDEAPLRMPALLLGLGLAITVTSSGIAPAHAPVLKEAAANSKEGLKESLAAKQAEKEKKEKEEAIVRRATAVTLNYCRASFYRIQRWPTLRVLVEEQEKILNNLDLNGIADQEVVKLYTGVLVEISEVRLADRERHVVQERYHTNLGTVLTSDALDFGCELASAHYLSAVRTGARSWWDYRNAAVTNDSDVFHVDQKRMMAFTEKSGQFLDTFWKLARDRKIPDRWLVRNHDLYRLDAAMQESNLRVRLRVLKRMENFMTCYPPYWYYLGRTQQALGQLAASAATYDKLFELGHGHFRKDDMLAAGLANEAVIQDFLHLPCAAETAAKALGFSTEVWEANLMCAHVLGRGGRFDEAEDAVLRNLDVGLERAQSAVALVSLYALRGNAAKLQGQLTDPAVVRRMPMPSLIRAAAALGPQKLPDLVVQHWASSLMARYDLKFGPDEFVLDTAPLWNLQASELSLVIGKDAFHQSTIALMSGTSEVRFAKVGEIGHPFYATSSPPPAVLIVKYPGAPIVRLRFDAHGETVSRAAAAASLPVVDMLASASLSSRRQTLFLTSIEIGNTSFPVAGRQGTRLILEDESESVSSPPVIRKPGDKSAEKPATAGKTTPSSMPGPSGKSSAEVAAGLVGQMPPPPIPLLLMPKIPVRDDQGPKLFP